MTERELLDQASDSDVVEVTLSVSTKLDEVDPETGKKKKLEKDFKARIPKSLKAFESIFGDKKSYRMAVDSLVIKLQGEERAALQTAAPGEGRKKAPYLETLGL